MSIFKRQILKTEKDFEDSFENSLAIEIIILFSIIAKADELVTQKELDYVRYYFDSFYPKQISEELFKQFEDFLDVNLDINQFTYTYNSGLPYENRVFILMKIYELIKSDTIQNVELKTARKISNLLRIQESDIDFIESIYGLAQIDLSKKADSNIILLHISNDISKADVYFPYKNLQLEIYQINDLYCAINKDPSRVWTGKRLQNKILIGAFPLRCNFATIIRPKDNILINDYTINFEDLQFYFKNKTHPLPVKNFYLTEDHNLITLDFNNSPKCILQIELNRSIIVLAPLKENVDLFVNGNKVSKKTYVNLNDHVAVNDTPVNLREIVFEHILQKEYYKFNIDKLNYTITNALKGDVVIKDDLDEIWKCEITKKDNKYYLDIGNCPYHIYLNQNKLQGGCEILQNDTLYIQGHRIRCDFNNGTFEKTIFSFRNYIVKRLRYLFSDNSIGLDDISFDIEHGDLVGIIGPSGCGKSTLLNVMSGYCKPTQGEVLLDSYNLNKDYDIIKDYLGYVPQDDLLFDNLTVYENLYYNAKLRFPNKKRKDIDALVNKVLRDISLLDKKNTRVGNPIDKILSGGERKRLNIGLELLGDAEVYLLDEPVSGLSSKDSEKIIDLLKKLSLKGKIVFVVIHQPGSRLYKMFDKIILLDNGGKLAFFGDKYSALKYFKAHSDNHSLVEIECPNCKRVAPDLLLDTLEEPLRDIDGTSLYRRKYSPNYWKQRYLDYKKNRSAIIKAERDRALPLPPQITMSLRERWKRFNTLLSRNFKNKLRNKSNLLITFLEAPILGGGVGFILKYSPRDEYTLYDNELYPLFIFLAVIISIFLAMTNSVNEIIKDAAILLREKMLNIKNRSYLAAKFLTLLVFAFIQNAFFLLAGFWALEVKELFPHYLIFLTLVSMSGIAMGLFISSIPNLSSKAALNIVPLILIPQIIFGGALITYEEMNKHLKIDKENPIPEICQIMPSRWAFEGLMVLHDTFNSYQSTADYLQKEFDDFRRSHEKYIKAY
ncbi:MAG: ATP-binding cassette domain-containing protein, partial [bacterium]